MSFQVLVKTTAVMNGAYTFLLSDRAAAMEFIRRPDVWWYHFPLEDDDWVWHRGGAWKPGSPDAHFLAAVQPEPAPADVPGAVSVEWQDEEDDDGRW